MSRFFHWCMRYGAALLFAFAVAQFLIGLIPLLYTLFSETGRMASNLAYAPDHGGLSFALQLQLLLQAVAGAAFPFFAALLIHRLGLWLEVRKAQE